MMSGDRNQAHSSSSLHPLTHWVSGKTFGEASYYPELVMVDEQSDTTSHNLLVDQNYGLVQMSKEKM